MLRPYLNAQISPAQFLSIFEIVQRLRADDVLNLVRFNCAESRRTKDIDHIADKDFTSFDVTRGTQTPTLHNSGIDLILCDELVSGTKRTFKQTCFFDHARPLVRIHRKLMIWSFAVVAVCEVTFDHARTKRHCAE